MNSSPYFAPAARDRGVARVLRRPAPEPMFSLRRRQALCVGFLLVWPAFYAMRAYGAPMPTSSVTPMTMRVGSKAANFPLAPGAKWFIEEGVATARVEARDGCLSVHGLSRGTLRLRIETGDKIERIAIRFSMPDDVTPASSSPLPPIPIKNAPPLGIIPVATPSPITARLVSRVAQSQITPGGKDDPLNNIPPIPTTLSGGTSPAPAAGSATPGVNPATAPAGFPNGGARVNPPAGFPNGLPDYAPTLPAPSSSSNSNILKSPEDPAPVVATPLPQLPSPSTSPSTTRPSTTRPSTTRPSTTRPSTTKQTTTSRPAPSTSTGGPQVVRPLPPAPPRDTPSSGASQPPRISPNLPAPARGTNAQVPYRTTPRLPSNSLPKGTRPGIEVTQGLARLVTFPDNILSVFFSDPNVMDARAINARTIAVTGTGSGDSTLAVFTARYPGDAVGRANVYRVQTVARGGSAQAPALSRDPQAVQAAITDALGDPRIRASVVRVPDGSLAARLTGTVRNTAEVDGAVTTTNFFVGRVISSLYADPTAPSIDAVLNGSSSRTTEGALQDSLRRLTGNDSIELITLPGGLVLKAQTDSTQEAEAILRVLPALSQPVTPFIVVRGQSSAQNPYYSTQTLQGEDRQLTEHLQAATGVTSVTVVRASPNTIAIYGTVQTRAEYQAVRRYATILSQSATAGSLRPTGVEAALPSYDPAGGYLRPLGLQMFVRILDPAQATIRNVTVETNVVEVSRTALQNLGVQYGSASLTAETVNNGTTTVVRDGAGNPVIDSSGKIVTQTTGQSVIRTVSPSINTGVATAGNGFLGQGGFGFIDPFRAQLNALEQRGDARILARPNVSALEGMPAQITIGGERPVPSAVAVSGGGGGAVGQSVEFRRYGVIISMRPTVTDDNTILLQIRADITQPDRTFEINLNGALIPGETVRSIDTSIAVRPGDVIIMGGLLTNEKRQQTSKVPILGDLPIIGSLFRSKRFENNETELAIFMTPRITALPASMDTQITSQSAPAFPTLPSRQEANSILLQNNTRTPG